ncbi:AI-2E family transporter [Candidatus Gracilibacteria bacterium]|nr:AI-2E family transporter [Candidatus Gracilibacteria bacterium]
MVTLKTALPVIFGPIFWRKLIAYLTLFVIGYSLSDFLILFFVTFLFAYIFLELGTYLAQKIHNWGIHGKEDRAHRIARKYATVSIVITGLYIIFISILVFIFVNIIPQIGGEISKFLENAGVIARQGQDFIARVETATNLNLGLKEMLSDFLSSDNLESAGQKAFSYVTNAGIIFTKFLLALLLSYLFLIERIRIEKFLAQIRNGNFQFLYDEWAIIAQKVGTGFGLIFRAQSIIALVNAILTSIGLVLISIFHGGAFPFIITLSLIVFICGFIPVFGTFLSGVPILILGYGFGGIPVVFALVAMIAIVHAVEAYYLNPKIVSSYVHFPVFITFVILLISEHMFGLLGLLIGVPLFSILLSLVEDFDVYVSIIRTELKKRYAALDGGN